LDLQSYICLLELFWNIYHTAYVHTLQVSILLSI